jgi:predicted DNA-binding protein
MSARGGSRKKKATSVELSPEMEECLQTLLSIMQKDDAPAFNEPVDW